MKIVTFVDSGVLIAAARSPDEVAQKALRLLDDPDRILVASDFVRLEVLPKAIHHKRKEEVAFYEAYFASVDQWPEVREITQRAHGEASRFGLSAIDALHVAAAVLANASEFITTEKLPKPIHRVTHFKITSIAS